MEPHKEERNGESPPPETSSETVNKTAAGHHNTVTADANLTATVPAQIPVEIPTPEPSADKELNMIDVRQVFEDCREDRYTIVFCFGLLVLILVSTVGFFLLSWSWITAIVGVLIGFIIFRHVSIKREIRPRPGRGWVTRRHPNEPVPDLRRLPAVYFLYVLGSGGHTTEMLNIIKNQFHAQPNQHRRYVVTAGDDSSISRVVELEVLIRSIYPGESAGTIDSFAVPRARKVHQSFLTTPLTCLATALQAVNVLTREPNARPATRHGRMFKYPHVVVTNGPATGFVVCLVAHLLKVFYLVPQNRLKMVYVESWARVRSLSLTGRLFRWTGIADVFAVQHEELARRYPGADYVGPIAAEMPYSRLPRPMPR
ncbi:hypothetical protein VTK56DRAFT_9921 [Thermocarpiscus australiensis]